MTLLLAVRNLIHDRVSLLVTLTGIVFSVVLVSVQLGIYSGVQRTILGIIDHTQGDLWVVPLGAKSVDDSPLLPGREKYVALATPGVENAIEFAMGFAKWTKPDGGSLATVMVGTDIADGGLAPWNLVAGDVAFLREPSAVAVDTAYLTKLGITGLGDIGQIAEMEAHVVALTSGIRSFTTLPYVFTPLDRARTYMGARPDQSTFVLVQLQQGVDAKRVQADLASRLHDAEVLTTAEFRDRSVRHWLYGTGAGAALIAGAVLGLIVGTVIVAQTLYSSTKDHLNEFATLRALGAGARYIHKVILWQALISAVLGFGIGIALALIIVRLSKGSSLAIIMSPGLAASLFALTLAMCVFSALAAIVKVTRIDPAMVFKR